MPLELEQLLAEPGLGLELVAGRAGVRRRGPIRWVHSSELPDPTPWLEGGELLLTTGLGVRADAALQRRLMAGLDAAGCTGVGFGLGVVMEQVPEVMSHEADVRGVPLFTVPYETPFIAITKRVFHHVAAEQYARLRSAVDLHRHVLAAVIAGGGVGTVLATVARQLPGDVCVAFDYYGKVLAAAGNARVDTDGLWHALARHRLQPDRFEVQLNGSVATGSSIRLGDEVEAVVAVVSPQPLVEHQWLVLDQALAGVGLELARGLSVREMHRSRVDDALDEVGSGRLRGADLRRHLERVGFDASRSYRVLGVKRRAGVSERALCAAVEDIVGGGGPPVVGRSDGLVVAVAQPADSDAAARIASVAEARGWDVTVGCSRTKSDVEAFAAALREARVAAASPAGGVADIADLGLAGVLSTLDDDAGAAAFVAAVIGPVLAHDDRESTVLADTLRAYLRHGCRPGPAADELRVHRHTLAYRLDRIRDLTGRDPRDGAHLLEFGLALELAGRAAGA